MCSFIKTVQFSFLLCPVGMYVIFRLLAHACTLRSDTIGKIYFQVGISASLTLSSASLTYNSANTDASAWIVIFFPIVIFWRMFIFYLFCRPWSNLKMIPNTSEFAIWRTKVVHWNWQFHIKSSYYLLIAYTKKNKTNRTIGHTYRCVCVCVEIRCLNFWNVCFFCCFIIRRRNFKCQPLIRLKRIDSILKYGVTSDCCLFGRSILRSK